MNQGLSVLPGVAELLSMWPLWLVLLTGLTLWKWVDHQDAKEWERYEQRMRRREIADRIRRRESRRN